MKSNTNKIILTFFKYKNCPLKFAKKINLQRNIRINHEEISEELQIHFDEDPEESTMQESIKKKTANLEDFLASLGLFKHKESFEEQEVDLNMMIEMDEEDVKE